MSTIAWILGATFLLWTAIAVSKAVRRGLSDPSKIQAAIDDHYQERLKSTTTPSQEYEFDFCFSAPTERIAAALRRALEAQNYLTSSEQSSPDEWIVQASQRLLGSAINLRASRAAFLQVCEPLGAKYIGPGERGLQLAGINLQGRHEV